MRPHSNTLADPDQLLSLTEYGIDPQRGFVPGVDPLTHLPAGFDAWEQAVRDLSPLLRSRQLRRALAALPLIDTQLLRDTRERERALLLLTVLASAWVWVGPEPEVRIPPQLAVPLCTLATTMGRPPIVHYASMALHNWRRVDPNAPLSADNACTLVQLLGSVDEDWFYIASLGVELEGAPLLPDVHAAVSAAAQDDDAALALILDRIASGMNPVLTALERMREWCDPYVFYHRLRPYVLSWPHPGVIYEGVSEEPRMLAGGSAAQSSLLQVIDALLGVKHGPIAGPYLVAVRQYMPPLHRRFVENVERCSTVRTRVNAGSDALREAYNAALNQVELFRRRHMGLAHEYVVRPSGSDPHAKGTGGTTLADFLQDARNETARAKF